jgi:hypothetical protein
MLVPDTGEMAVSKLQMPPIEVVSFLEGLGSGVRAVYEAGPTGFGLASIRGDLMRARHRLGKFLLRRGIFGGSVGDRR